MIRTAIAAAIGLLALPGLCIARDAGAIPAYVLELPDSVSDVLVADTQAATLYRFGRTSSGVEKIDQRYMSIGQNGVGKKRAWDRKTPLGVYFITERLDTDGLHDKYGIAAYPLDYPNAWDRYNARTGDGIWLHGMDGNGSRRPPRDTDGCLALPNDELSALASVLKPLVTPVIVAREMIWSLPHELEGLRKELRTALETWRQSLEQNDLLAYLSLYAEDFRHYRMDRDDWASYRLGVFDARRFESVKLDDVLLVADPEQADLYLSRFTQEVVSDGVAVTTIKRLYWKRNGNREWRIVAEDAG